MFIETIRTSAFIKMYVVYLKNRACSFSPIQQSGFKCYFGAW